MSLKRQGKSPDRSPGLSIAKQKQPSTQPGGRSALTLLIMALLVVGLWVSPATAADLIIDPANCDSCHGSANWEAIHLNVPHTANAQSGVVLVFDDFEHDSVNWDLPSPQYAVQVNCGLCHVSDLRAIHAYDCSTCHTSPYNTLQGNWQGGCQQGGCHATVHADATTAHLPFARNASDAECNICHNWTNNGTVAPTMCLGCHANYAAPDSSKPVTKLTVLPSYIGPAIIDFSMTDNGGKVGLGRTFHKLDNGPKNGGGKLTVSTPGAHVLEYWSVDQAGNTEAARSTSFTIVADTTKPVTTSNAKAIYEHGGQITLTATDNGYLGVKATYYSIDNGPVQTGTIVPMPGTAGPHTLRFWSVDYSGNIENSAAPANNVSFTIMYGYGTIRLSWGDSDVSGSPCPGDPEAEASWDIYKAGTPLKWLSGSAGCPNWNGVNDIVVPVSATPYTVIVPWWYSGDGYWDESYFPSVYVTTPGQVVLLRY